MGEDRPQNLPPDGIGEPFLHGRQLGERGPEAAPLEVDGQLGVDVARGGGDLEHVAARGDVPGPEGLRPVGEGAGREVRDDRLLNETIAQLPWEAPEGVDVASVPLTSLWEQCERVVFPSPLWDAYR